MDLPEPAERCDTTAVVLLADGAGGRELEAVGRVLTDCLDTPVVLIGRADLESTPMTLDMAGGLLEVGGRRLRPAVAWIRHGSASALAAQARPAGSLRPLQAEAWSRFLAQIAAAAGTALPGPGGTVLGPRQLLDAARLGMATPRTVVTTDVPAAVRELRDPGGPSGAGRGTGVIVKQPDFRLYEPDRSAWPKCFPSVLDGTADAVAHRADHPVVVQEYVAHSRELRVYHLDGGICAFEVGKPQPSSPWTDPGSVTVTPVLCPPAAAHTVRTLCAAWNLRYGAFDLLVSDTGQTVFLEANPDGDWLWFEDRARWRGVTFMAAVMVRDLYVRSTR